MIITCMRCGHRAFVFMFESKRICRRCQVWVSKPHRDPKKFSYKDAQRDQHKRRVERASSGVRKKPLLKRSYSVHSATTRGPSDSLFESSSEAALPPPPDMSLDDAQPFFTPNVLRLQCMVLFIPFDAGNNFYKSNAKQGTSSADFIPSSGNMFAPFSQPLSARPLASFNNKTYPGQKTFEARSTHMSPGDIQANYSRIVMKHIAACTNSREWKRVHASGAIDMHMQLSRLCPEVIFLSEELKDAPFPSELRPCPELTYRRIGSLKEMLPDVTVDVKNEIAAYVLVDEKSFTQVLYNARVLHRKGCNHGEKWLSVQKIVPEYRVYIEVAGVHLDAGYTKYTPATKKQEALAEVGQFARDNEVDALLGDLNMDSFELDGGFFPNAFSFKDYEVPGSEKKKKVVKPVYTLSHSNTNAKNNYMGGIIVNSDQVETEPMNLRGDDTVSLSRTLDGEFYSDHPAILANYVKSFY
ncbi:hypothetical protein [Myxococcus landrumensis]|uniref:Endonuclease/exonuclease/phosphatase domain-containing protein n=1 Tax=Myxococcus landrumensis TaxID=2813577 RepID=A0ABX7N6L2_9BACT|nr:hypothetical protein [Myxococcus landrumus]QSQ13297.1 hypothetical protein JY572_33955 [Myxococcus landrumus]